ncbi:plasmid replication protein, CyRepA1 family [Pandoraea anhela]|uniref:Replication origin-binding protein domain-containing protein n=1 Tax=Pandoraea anhela TaxID=2508295 RepID=A0A5E4XP80_9BURK|nr:plasmid replication protein, CyRepA1 family [Pandoraea anhela]VVE38096.1 hypothetical protein PAN31108_03992 [Pandoraea anhela]
MSTAFAVSLNQHIINKNANGGNLGKGWEPFDMTREDLAKVISMGVAFSAQYKDGQRSQANFERTGFIAVDVDHGMSWNDAIEHPYVKAHAALAYTTASHTDDHHRFRIVFQLSEPIVDAQRYRQVMVGLVGKFLADTACAEPARVFYGSRGCESVVFDGILDSSEIAQILLLADNGKIKEEAVAYVDSDGKEQTHKRKASSTSKHWLVKTTELRLARGGVVPLNQAEVRTPVYCPVHVDSRASAFVVHSSDGGGMGVHCVACGRTYWADRGSPTFDLHEYDRRVEKLIRESFDTWLREKNTNTDMFDFDTAPPGLLQERFLPNELIPLQDGVTIIKSPKGSGKTTVLRSVVDEAKRKGKSVLLMGHRQTLLRSMAQRLGLTCYFDLVTREGKEGDGTGEQGPVKQVKVNINPTRHYAVCMDSLQGRLNTQEDKYDVIILDEVEQVISHLLVSKTLRLDRRRIYNVFRYYLRNAKSVYLLDADMNAPTVIMLREILSDGKDRSYHVIQNTYPTGEGKEICVYQGDGHLRSVMEQMLVDGKRLYVCSNSKTEIDALEIRFQTLFGESKKIFKVTSDNSQDAEVQQFLSDVSSRILGCDVLLASPAIGTGIDITFPNGEALVDATFGIFKSEITTHFDIDQQLSRVRNPKEIHVWISPETADLETDPEVVKLDLVRYEPSLAHLESIEDTTGIRVIKANLSKEEDEFLTIFSYVTALQRASKNLLKNNFIDLRKSTGWVVNIIETDRELNREGRKGAAAASTVLAHRRAADVVIASAQVSDEVMNPIFDKLRHNEKLTPHEENLYMAYRVESYLGAPVTIEKVAEFDDGNLPRQVRQYLMLRNQSWARYSAELARYEQFKGGPPMLTDQNRDWDRIDMLRKLFISAGIYDDERGFLTEVEYSVVELEGFVEECRKSETRIQSLWAQDRVWRRDAFSKPAGLVGNLLELVGVAHDPKRSTNITLPTGKQRKIDYKQIISGTVERMERYMKAELERLREKSPDFEERARRAEADIAAAKASEEMEQ